MLEWKKLKHKHSSSVTEYLCLFNETMFIRVDRIQLFSGGGIVWCASASTFIDSGAQLGCTVLAKRKTMIEAKKKAEQWLAKRCKEMLERLEIEE